MSTDRPDRTESPYTVPAKHFQLEMDLATYGRFDTDDTKIGAWAVAPFNLKYGLADRVDVQLMFAPYLHTTVSSAGSDDETDDGTGPAGVRVKLNLAGNDDSNVAVAVIPYFLAPTRGTGKLDNTLYGVVVPVTFPLDGGRAIGAMAGVEQLADSTTFGIASVTFSTPIADGWGGFVELFSVLNGFDDDDSQIVTLDAGVIFAPRDNWAIDAGVYYGLTSDTENWRVFAGLSARS